MVESTGRRWWRLDRAALAVLVVLLAATGVGWWGARSEVRAQEHTLLVERTNEARAYVDSAFSGLPPTLGGVLGVVTASGSPQTFGAVAAPLARRGYDYLQLLTPDGTVLATAGASPQPVGARVDSATAALLASSARRGAVLATPIRMVGASRHLGFVLASGRYAVYADAVVHPFAASLSGGQPFHEIDGALYAAPSAQPSQLFSANTRSLPLRGSTAHALVGPGVAGAGISWLLVTAARQPLIGAGAALPWIVLGFGLALALVATATVSALVRRRQYALELAAERTAELRTSLAELEQTQQQLVRSERLAAIGQLASVVGHELRNPLGVLTNVVYLLRTRLRSHPEAAEGLERHLLTAEREIGAASLIVSDLLEFAREREPVRAPMDLVELLEEVLAVAPPPAGVQVLRRVAEPLPALRADRDQLRQVVLNLLTNAYDALPDGGTVTIQASGEGGALMVEVSDTGAGIPEEALPRLFEPFFTTKARGIGLGLAVCRRIATAHGGTLEAGGAPGGGACFRLVLPVGLPEQPDGASAPQSTAVAP